MLAITLSFILAAPIPKTVYEGQIAVVFRTPKPTMLLLKPNGQEVRRVEQPDLTSLYTIKNSRNSEWALVTCSVRAIQIGNRGYATQDGYLVKWDDSAKPKKVIEGRPGLKWVLNRDATKAYGTDVDQEKAAADPQATKSWELDLATGKEKPIAIPSGNSIIDISADDQTIILSNFEKNQYSTKLASTSDWKTSDIKGESYYPHGLSPDGKKMLITEYANPAKGTDRVELMIVDRETNAKAVIPKPTEILAITAYSFGADGKRITFAGYSQDQQPNGRIILAYRIYVANIDGSGVKKIFEPPLGESISDVDWR